VYLYSLCCANGFLDTESSRKLRESFAKACFETLLQFSFVIRSTSASSQDDGAITQIAILSLLDRCKSVLVKFVADERLSGKCPLPRFSASFGLTILPTVWCLQELLFIVLLR